MTTVPFTLSIYTFSTVFYPLLFLIGWHGHCYCNGIFIFFVILKQKDHGTCLIADKRSIGCLKCPFRIMSNFRLNEP